MLREYRAEAGDDSASCACSTLREEVAAAIYREKTGQPWSNAVRQAATGNHHYQPLVRDVRAEADEVMRSVRARLAKEQATDWPGDLARRLGSASIVLQAMEANAAGREDVVFAMQCGAAVKAVEDAKALVRDLVR